MQVLAVPNRVYPSVMLVEDDQDMGDAIAIVLQHAGYKVERCYDGTEALQQLSEGKTPDLILLDLKMPNMDGWQFRVEQRGRQEWSSIPVVVITADKSAPAAAIDADRYLQKPIQPSTLLDAVERLLLAREGVRLEMRAAELDRLSSLGVLAAGIAHEINNPLAVVLGSLELVQHCLRELGPQAATSNTVLQQ
jgi:CheY-like chemotaxis protein